MIKNYIRTILFAIVILTAFCVCGRNAYAAEQLKIHMINVGNGDSFLVECNGHYALIDGGYISHAAQTKDGKNSSTICRLDKYETLEDALDGRVQDLDQFYSHNLLSFFEHFDNDMKLLTGENNTVSIMTAAREYIDEFDGAVEDYQEKTEAYNSAVEQYNEYLEALGPEEQVDTTPPVKGDTILSEEEWVSYKADQEIIDDIRNNIGTPHEVDTQQIKQFMELQRNSNPIKQESTDSAYYRYYSALGYQLMYEQADYYMKSSEYIDKEFNDCLTYLNSLEITKLDYVVSSHSHKDHVGGLAAILASDEMEIGSIIYNGTSYGTANFRIFEHEMLDRQAEGLTDIIVADDNENNTFTLGDSVLFTELGNTEGLPKYTREPDRSSSTDFNHMNHIVNNQSLVYRMDYNGVSMMFTGDAEGINDDNGYNRQIDILSKHGEELDVDIYKAAHHCHNNASNTTFNDAMSPCFVMASCGLTNDPHVKARKALKGADIWISKGNGRAVVASISKNSFRIFDGSGKNITNSPTFKHKLDYAVTSSFGTPNKGQIGFAPRGRKVTSLRTSDYKTKFYNPPTNKSIRLTAAHGWYYDQIQYQLCLDNKKYSSDKWNTGSVTTLNQSFHGTVYYRFSNKFGKSIIRKTDGLEFRVAQGSIRRGKAVLYKYNAARVDWYPVAGAKQYKVWYKKGEHWKSKGKTQSIYKDIAGLPAGKKVTLRVKAIGKKGYAYITVRTLRKMDKPQVGKSGEKIKISWARIAGATGYQVAVNSKVKVTAATGKSAKVQVPQGKKLKYKVRAYKKNNGVVVYGPWSDTKSYKR